MSDDLDPVNDRSSGQYFDALTINLEIHRFISYTVEDIGMKMQPYFQYCRIQEFSRKCVWSEK